MSLSVALLGVGERAKGRFDHLRREHVSITYMDLVMWHGLMVGLMDRSFPVLQPESSYSHSSGNVFSL